MRTIYSSRYVFCFYTNKNRTKLCVCLVCGVEQEAILNPFFSRQSERFMATVSAPPLIRPFRFNTTHKTNQSKRPATSIWLCSTICLLGYPPRLSRKILRICGVRRKPTTSLIKPLYQIFYGSQEDFQKNLLDFAGWQRAISALPRVDRKSP
jgi:hypothetical protein